MESILFYSIALILLLISFFQDREKTKKALMKTLKGIQKLLPQMSFILIIIGLSMSLISPERISGIIGNESGVGGVALSIATGAVSLLPAFITFPLGAALLEQGAGLLQVAGFISALMGIGILTFSMEKKYFGQSFAIYRNVGSLVMTVLFVAVLFATTGGI